MPEKHTFVEKRSHPRIPQNLPVRYRVIDDPIEIEKSSEGKKAEKSTRCMDISLSGLFIVSDQPVIVGSTLRLDIALPVKSALISAFAEVIWANESGKGLKIIAIKKDDEDILKSYIEKIA